MQKIWNILHEEDDLGYTQDISKKCRICYAHKSMSDNFLFNSIARKEVLDVQWISLQDLTSLKIFAVLLCIYQLQSQTCENTNAKYTTLCKGQHYFYFQHAFYCILTVFFKTTNSARCMIMCRYKNLNFKHSSIWISSKLPN